MMEFELAVWSNGVTLYHEDRMHGNDIVVEIVMDEEGGFAIVDGKRVDLCEFLFNLAHQKMEVPDGW